MTTNCLLDARGGVGKSEAGGSFGALGDGRVELVAQAVVEHQAGRNLPRVLGKKRKGIAVDGRRSDVLAPGEVRGRDGDGVDEGASAEQAGERVRQRISSADVMQAALRGNVDGGIGGASAKVIFAIGADTKVGGVAVQPHLGACLEGVAGGGEGKILAQLEEIAVDADDRSRRPG